MANSVPAFVFPASLWGVLLACLVLIALAAGAAAETERPRSGLMWNKTGLPAVFPLQVKSPPGADYYLVLSSEDSGEEALAAYFKGGAFFKVLVPPGRYLLHFASGSGWQGEGRLFGPGTRVFKLPEVLEFAIRGAGIKGGHKITLTRSGAYLEAAVKEQYICQVASLDGPAPVPRPLQDSRHLFRLGGDRHERWSLHLQLRLGLRAPEAGTAEQLWQRRRFVLGNPLLPRRQAGLQDPAPGRAETRFRSYSVRSLYCG
ncbi:hypothetical protein [Leisingera sp. MMG026]|uniref:hypothetical protein n=1 Tax=Leisingera sp. MMG026 TaxID=2909982 RepID=UPI001F2A334E|nr:hypothetical protein [Leisingera sp. MMG026]MCF6433299.1 hypothetical protein [Leisingera sp. MMG026]